MSKFLKLLERIKNNPKTVKFDELDKILLHEGYERSQSHGGSSHYQYRKSGKNLITIPYHKPYIKEFYVGVVLKELGI